MKIDFPKIKFVDTESLGGEVMEDLGRWLVARLQPRRSGDETDTWLIVSKAQNSILGEVRWFGWWGRYAFYPRPDIICNKERLYDIQAFLAKKRRAPMTGVA